MSEIKRIDPKAIPELFKKHGMVPKQEVFIERHADESSMPICCCVNTILAVDGAEVIWDALEAAEKASENPGGHIAARDLCEFTRLRGHYAVALAYGWDGTGEYKFVSPEGIAGWQDGRAAWEACQELLQEVGR